MDTPPTLIDDRAACADLGARATNSALLALDTEFMREKTYRAELCLLQVGTASWQTCLDPLSLALERDAEWLCALWQSGNCELVMHAARQDLEVLQPLLGAPCRVFDTQVAAALVGLPPQVGYAELVRRLLGVELAKAETRTDWSRRPLTDSQIEYALADVRHLPELYAKLTETLRRLNRLGWLAEDLADLDGLQEFDVPPEQAWVRVKGLHGLDDARKQLARLLAAWRERRAVQRNRPRGWILDDSVLRALVQSPPRTLDELKSVPEMPRGVVEHVGAELLALIESCGLPAVLPPLPRRARPDPAIEASVRRLSEITRETANELAIAPEVLATRRDLEQMVRGDSGAAPLCGWRRAVVGEKLQTSLS